MATSPWYREGTAKFTQGSTTVTGTGTRWVDFVRAGDGIQGPDGKLYQVTNVASNTSMSITPAYGNETTYWTIPIQGYVKRLADAASQLVRDFEGGADEALDAADRAKQSAIEANVSEAAALSQANRAEAEADRAETEADRAQQAADDAVAVVSGGEASIDPEPGKIPIAGAEGTIKQAWVHELEFALDKLRVATNKALYGNGPYPVLDFQFQGARYLDPRIEFSRASMDWGPDGKAYGINEPVLTEEGLWVSGSRTNLIPWSRNLENWSSVNVGFGGDNGNILIESSASGSHYIAHTVSLQGDDVSVVVSFKVRISSQRFLQVRFGDQINSGSRAYATISPSDLTHTPGATAASVDFCNLTKDEEWVKAEIGFTISSAGAPRLFFILSDTPFAVGAAPSYVGDGVSFVQIDQIQLETGNTSGHPIPTHGSQVTVAMTLPTYQNVTPSLRLPHLTLLASGKIKGRGNGLTGANSRRHVFILRGKTGNERIYIYFENRASDITLGVVTFSTGGAISTFTHSSFQELPKGSFRVGVRVQQDGVSVTFNGVSRFFNASFESTLDVVEFGRSGSDRFLLGYLDCFVLFKEHLTDQQLEELTS